MDHDEKGDAIFEYVDTKNQLPDLFAKLLFIKPFYKIHMLDENINVKKV